MTAKRTLVGLFTISAILLSGCKKDFDSPPVQEIPVGALNTISDLRAMYSGSPISFSNDETVYAVVTADEVSGNIYKNAYIYDGTGAIVLRLLSSGGLYVGDSIRINLNGTVLSDYNGHLQIDSVDVDNNIVKVAVGVPVTPVPVTVADLQTDTYESYLVSLQDVQFMASELGQTYADAVGLFSENRMLEDCFGNSVIVRSSGYANFAGTTIDPDNGSFIAAVGEFNGDIQLYIRDLTDLNMTNPRCSGGGNYLDKDFEDDDLYSGGWTTQVVLGPHDWESWFFSPDYFARVSNWNGGGNDPSETWYISPAVDLSTATNPELTFRSAYNFSGAALELYVSTDYDGVSAPSSATWTPLSATWPASGGYVWQNSGAISLASYLQAGVYIAYRYQGSGSDGRTWEVDDIIIAEN